MIKMMPKRNGFTLLEVLVTLIILSIGLLGLLSLQISSLKYTHSSYERTRASIYAKDIVERMWSTNLKIKVCKPATGAATCTCTITSDGTTATTTCANLTGSKMLPVLPANWTMEIERMLDTSDKTANDYYPKPDTYNITVNWTDPRFGSASFRDSVRLLVTN